MYLVFECMDLDLNKLGRDQKQTIGLDHVRWFMYQVLHRCLVSVVILLALPAPVFC